MKIHQPPSQAIHRVRTGSKRPSARLLVAGWLVLALYFLDYSPVGIAAAALVGSLDPAHEVQVQFGASGLQLVLHHGHGCHGHHHGVIAKTLTIFAQPASTANPDHLLKFGSANFFANTAQVRPSTLSLAELPLPVLDLISLGLPNSSPVAAESPRPPPGEQGLLACLRSTVFLI